MQAQTMVATPPLQIVIGGLSCAPVSIATTVAPFKPSGVSYTKVPPPVDSQQYTGCHPAGLNTYSSSVMLGDMPEPVEHIHAPANKGAWK